MFQSMHRGAVANIPLAVSAVTYGGVLGVLSAQQGTSWLEILCMDVLMFAGSAQFVMVEMWQAPLPVLQIALAVFAVNLRYVLIGASLQPVFSGHPVWRKALLMHLVADENWAVTIAEHRRRGTDPYFLFGGGVLLLCAWTGGTVGGNLLGAFIAEPEKYALDFAFVAVFAALTLSLWRGKTDLVPWLAAGILSLASEHWLPGKWYIVIGGLGGALAAALRRGERRDDPKMEGRLSHEL